MSWEEVIKVNRETSSRGFTGNSRETAMELKQDLEDFKKVLSRLKNLEDALLPLIRLPADPPMQGKMKNYLTDYVQDKIDRYETLIDDKEKQIANREASE